MLEIFYAMYADNIYYFAETAIKADEINFPKIPSFIL